MDTFKSSRNYLQRFPELHLVNLITELSTSIYSSAKYINYFHRTITINQMEVFISRTPAFFLQIIRKVENDLIYRNMVYLAYITIATDI